jgi:hypothetical protein
MRWMQSTSEDILYYLREENYHMSKRNLPRNVDRLKRKLQRSSHVNPANLRLASRHSTIVADGSVHVDKYFIRKLKGNKRIRRKKASFILYALYYVVLAGYLEKLQGESRGSHEEEETSN